MSNKASEKGLQVYTSRPWESIKTGFLVVTWIILGSHLELVGPTLKILSVQTGQTFAGISTILVTRGAGYVVGNIAGALVQSVVQKYPEGLLSISFLIASIVVLVTPLINDIYLLSTVFLFQGISQGVTDLGGTSLLLTMWADHVAVPLNIVHLGYGFGAIFANLFVRPFLARETTTTLANGTFITVPSSEPSNIRTPYFIVAFLCLIIAVGHLIFAIREYQIKRKALHNRPVVYSTVSTGVESKEKSVVEKKNISAYSPRSCGQGYFGYGLSMSIVWIFYMFFLSGNDQTFGKFFFTYLESKEYAISTEKATWFMIIYWLSYSIGRLICAVVAIFVPVHVALIGLWVCGLILAVAWYIFVWVIKLTSTRLVILGAFTGLVFSPTFPLSFAFINQRLNVNPLLVGLLLCGASSGAMSFQKLAGFIFDTNRNHFPTILIGCVLMSIVCFIIALIISSVHQKTSQSKAQLDKNINLNITDEEQQLETYVHTKHSDGL